MLPSRWGKHMEHGRASTHANDRKAVNAFLQNGSSRWRPLLQRQYMPKQVVGWEIFLRKSGLLAEACAQPIQMLMLASRKDLLKNNTVAT